MPHKTNQRFYLDKSYLDCIDHEGNCLILYAASIKIFFLKFHYTAFIFSDAQNKITEKSSFKKSELTFSDEGLQFFCRHFNIQGEWKKGLYPVQSVLYKNDNGIVNWNCHHPIADAAVQYNGQLFTGLGYAETLFLSMLPWQLPIDELRWGRFLAPGITITWIQWKGKYPVNKIYFNGIEMNDAIHSMEAILFNEGKCRLLFSHTAVLRHTTFGEHLSKLPLVKLLVNKAMLNSVESKYKSATRFTDASGTLHHGWSIFELVKWEH